MDFITKRLISNHNDGLTVGRYFAMGLWLSILGLGIFGVTQAELVLAALPFGAFFFALFAGVRGATEAAAVVLELARYGLYLIPRGLTRRIEARLLRRRSTRRLENFVLGYIDSRRPNNKGSAFARAAASGDRRAAAEILWPATRFPHLYSPVPADLRRPPYEDGMLPGGVPLAHLADNALTETQIRRAVRAAATTFTVLLPTLLLTLIAGTVVSAAIEKLSGISLMTETIEAWGDHEITSSVIIALLSAAGDLLVATGGIAVDLAYIVAISPVIAAAFAAVTFLSYVGAIFHAAQMKYKAPTKDAVHRNAARLEVRTEAERSYVETVRLAQTRLVDKKLIEIGTATGTARLRGRLYAASALTPVCIDEDALSEGTLIIGSTGSGKTTGPIKSILYTVLGWESPVWSAFLQDGKGVLHRDVRAKLGTLGRRIVTIGTEAGEKGVNLLAFMSPLEAAEAMRSLSRQMSSEKNVWSEQAASLFRHALVIGRLWRETDDGRLYRAQVADPYSLAGGFYLAADNKLQARAIKAINNRILVDEDFARDFVDVDFEASRHYLDSIWPAYAIETRTSVQFSLDALLGELTAQPELYKRFFVGRDDDTTDFADLFDGSGTIYLSAIGGARHGKNGRIVNMLLNSILVKLAAARQVAIGEQAAKAKPILAIVDEAHLTLSMDSEAAGTDVPSFLSITRSTGVAWLIATQSVDQLYSAFGEEAAKTLIANLRNKIFLSSENIETVRLITDLGGQTERNYAVEGGARESIDHRVAIDGFDPFSATQWIPRVDVRATNTRFGSGLTAAFNGLKTSGVGSSIEVNGSFTAHAAIENDSVRPDAERDEAIVRQGATRETLYRSEDVLDLGDYHAIVFVRRGRNLFTDKVRVRHVFE